MWAIRIMSLDMLLPCQHKSTRLLNSNRMLKCGHDGRVPSLRRRYIVAKFYTLGYKLSAAGVVIIFQTLFVELSRIIVTQQTTSHLRRESFFFWLFVQMNVEIVPCAKDDGSYLPMYSCGRVQPVQRCLYKTVRSVKLCGQSSGAV